jgi:hypothetical protein
LNTKAWRPSTLTVKEVVGHLRAVEERLDGDKCSSGGQLLLTERQWEERRKQQRGGGASGSGGGRHKVGKPQPKYAPVPDTGGEIDREKCHYCGKGH